MEAYIQYENGNAVFYATTAYCTDAMPIIELFCENMTVRIEDPTAVCRYHDGKTVQLDTTKLIEFGKSCYGGGHMDWANMSVKQLGKGNIDFERFFAFVKELGYQGDFTCEATAVNEDGSIRIGEMNDSLDRIRKEVTP